MSRYTKSNTNTNTDTNTDTNIDANINIEKLNKYYTYLDTILPILSEIYKCPCQSCISANTEKIQLMISTIQEYYYIIIDCKNFIKQNKFYLKKIKELIPHMITFNNVIIQDIVCINTQISVSIIYIDNENDTTEIQTQNTKNATFILENLFKYYPEM